MKIQTFTTAISVLALATPRLAGAQQVPFDELRPVEMAGEAEFGQSLDLESDLALLGAPGENAFGAQSGSVRILRFAGGAWAQEGTLAGSDLAAGSRFGESVDLDGERALVGAPGHGGAGAAYVFRLAGGVWTEEAKLAPEGMQRFGMQVALRGDTAVVLSARAGEYAPSVLFVFRRFGASWSLEAEIDAPPADGWMSLALIEGVLFYGHLIGGTTDSVVDVHARDDQGTATVLDDAWTPIAGIPLADAGTALGVSLDADAARLVVGVTIFGWFGLPSRLLVLDRDDAGTPQDPMDDAWWLSTEIVGTVGWWMDDVTLDGDRILVGSQGPDSQLLRYDGAAWTLEETLPNPSSSQIATALDGGRALLASPGADDLGPMTGALAGWVEVGGVWSPTGELLPEGLIRVGGFGCAVALTDAAEGRVLVGAEAAETAGPEAGAAYVFRRGAAGGWVEDARLVPAGLAAGDGFGGAVAADGEWALVGASRRDGAFADQGAAYLFERRNGAWLLAHVLASPAPAAAGSFGSAVALLGAVALVGAPAEDHAGADAGAVHVYRFDGVGWSFSQTLLAEDAAPGAGFGRAIALSGGRALIGAPGADGAQGACYVFRLDAGLFVQEARLIAADGAPADAFGASCALRGDRALVGARLEDGLGHDQGAAYMFRRGTTGAWAQEQKLVCFRSSFEDQMWFGNAVALGAEAALVGMRHHAPGEYPSRLTRWTLAPVSGAPWFETNELADEVSGHPWDETGYALALAGDAAAVGSPRADASGATWIPVGSAFVGAIPPALVAEPPAISASAGGTQALTFDGPMAQPYLYLVVGSLSGTAPGFAIGPWTIPVNPDVYFRILLNEPEQSFATGLTGYLQFFLGDAEAKLTLAPGAAVALAGTTAHHAFVVYSPAIGAITYVSNAASLAILP